MHHIEIDVIGLQSLQRLVDRAHHVLATIAACVGVSRLQIVRIFARNDNTVARAGFLYELADQCFTETRAVGIRSVDEIATRFRSG